MIEYIKLKIIFKVQSNLFLTTYKGSTLGGMFKTALNRVFCRFPGTKCDQCGVSRLCEYQFVTDHRTATGENTVLPYLISCSPLSKRFYARNESIAFNLILFGSAGEYLDKVTASLKGWAKLDAGCFKTLICEREISEYGNPARWPQELVPRGSLRLEKVDQVTNSGIKTLYTPGHTLNSHEIESLTLNPDPGEGSWKVKLQFTSPTRIMRKIRSNGRRKKTLIRPNNFEPEIFFRSLLTRYTGLYQHYSGGSAEFGQKMWASCSSAIADVIMPEENNQLGMLKIARYERKKDSWHHKGDLDGFVGNVTFTNVSGSLVPWIMVGELSHIGKAPTLGYGEYRAEYISE